MHDVGISKVSIWMDYANFYTGMWCYIATYEASTDNVELILVVIMANSVYQAFILSVSSLVQLPYFIIITILHYNNSTVTIPQNSFAYFISCGVI